MMDRHLRRLILWDEKKSLAVARFRRYLEAGPYDPMANQYGEEFERRMTPAPFVPRDHRVELIRRMREGR